MSMPKAQGNPPQTEVGAKASIATAWAESVPRATGQTRARRAELVPRATGAGGLTVWLTVVCWAETVTRATGQTRARLGGKRKGGVRGKG